MRISRILNLLLAVWLAASLALTGCGGGGGSAGTPISGTGATASKAAPTLTLTLVDVNGVALPNNAIGAGSVAYARAVLKDAAGVPVGNALVTFSTDATVANVSPARELTDPVTGAAKVQISGVGLTGNVGTLTAATDQQVGGVGVPSASVNFRIAASNVVLSDLVASPASINALQTSAVSVRATVNGQVPAGNSVSVSFAASCGSFSPATAAVNNTGVATATYQADAACSGPVAITANASGANTLSTNVQVAALKAANILFVNASAPLMVVSSNTGGVKQSTLRFQVVDSKATGMAGQEVVFSLASTAKSAGVNFSLGGVLSQADQTVSTDSAGNAEVIVSSGSVPTPVVVTATLKSAPSISAASTGVAVTSGRAVQDKVSLSVDKYSIEGWNVDGVKAVLTMRVADRQSNPVPAGSKVTFVASHSKVGGECTIDDYSQCTVTFESQGTRPANGRAVVLAYMEGEETFVDANNDNVWQPGESFTDIGTLFRDDNESKAWESPEPQYLGGSVGSSACAPNTGVVNSVAGTCDGTWSSNIRVRQQVTIVLASSNAVISLVGARSNAGFTVEVKDINGNSMPTGSAVGASVATTGSSCSVMLVSPNSVQNSTLPTQHYIRLNGDASCSSATVDVTVTSPSGFKTLATF